MADSLSNRAAAVARRAALAAQMTHGPSTADMPRIPQRLSTALFAPSPTGDPLHDPETINAIVNNALGTGVIKPVGGQWLTGAVEGALSRLKPGRDLSYFSDHIWSNLPETLRQKIESTAPNAYETVMQDYPKEWSTAYSKTYPEDAALRDFVDRQLTRYVKNQMATPDDPIRALAEQGVLHYDPARATQRMGYDEGIGLREAFDMPGENIGQSPLARQWESISDASVNPNRAGEIVRHSEHPVGATPPYAWKELSANPWLSKVDPSTPVYRFEPPANMSDDELGFNHLIDELQSAMDPTSGLPQNLQLRPESLSKVSVPQAVQRVSDINAWRAKQASEANQAIANNPATFEHKTYDTIPGTDQPNTRGLRWVELRGPEHGPKDEIIPGMADDTGEGVDIPDKIKGSDSFKSGYAALQDALKYEGDQMGHCVGGYCPDVSEGRSRIFSLRDSAGQPHVTIETDPGTIDASTYTGNYIQGQLTPEELIPKIKALETDPRMARPDSLGTVDGRVDLSHWIDQIKDIKPSILQIKGKSNAAPVAEYQPFVQDFVRSQPWSDVGDLRNTGLQDILSDYTPDAVQTLRSVHGPDARYLTEDQIHNALSNTQNFADGGSVREKIADPILSPIHNGLLSLYDAIEQRSRVPGVPLIKDQKDWDAYVAAERAKQQQHPSQRSASGKITTTVIIPQVPVDSRTDNPDTEPLPGSGSTEPEIQQPPFNIDEDLITKQPDTHNLSLDEKGRWAFAKGGHVTKEAKKADTKPSEAQIEAGNYKKGHLKIAGLDISIENPAGSRRRPGWPPLKHHYGYIRGTIGKDKDHIDIFVHPDTTAAFTGPIFVVDQRKKNGVFDEHKVMLGFKNPGEARAGYLSNYTRGWTGFKNLTTFKNPEEFKQWLKTQDHTKESSITRLSMRVKKFAEGGPVTMNPNLEAQGKRFRGILDTAGLDIPEITGVTSPTVTVEDDPMIVSPEVQTARNALRLKLLQRELQDNPDDPLLPRLIDREIARRDSGDPFFHKIKF